MLTENGKSLKPSSEVMALAKEITDLEHRLKSLSKAAQPDEKSIRPIRQSLRDQYEKLILLDHKYALEAQVEQSLWKLVFYKRIEDYRKRHSRMSAAIQELDKKDRAAEALRSLNDSFSKFLDDSKKFYTALLQKLLDLCGIILPGYSQAGAAPSAGIQGERREAIIGSCHRCLIYLGDLERYAQLYVEGGQSDWKAPEKYYNAASLLLPHVGNPYNQKAVLATYRADDLAGVYCYARALLCTSPFATARENLMLLFEKNRQKCEDFRRWEHSVSAGRKGSHDARTKRRMEFFSRFVRLQGVLWTRIDMDDYKKIESAVLTELVSLLDVGDLDGMPLVMMAAVCIFIVNSAEQHLSDLEPSAVEKNKAEASLDQALAFSFKFFCKVSVSARVHDLQLSSLCVLSDWLSSNLQFLLPSDVDNQSAKKDLRTSRQAMIENLVDLLNLSNKDACDKREKGEFRPLAEDIELMGFIPLASAHQQIQRLTSNGTLVELKKMSEALDSKTMKWLRIDKLAKFAQKIAAGPRPLLFYDSQNGEYSVEGGGIFNLATAARTADGVQSQQRGKLMTPQLNWSSVVSNGSNESASRAVIYPEAVPVDPPDFFEGCSTNAADQETFGGADEADNDDDETFGEAVVTGVPVPDDFSAWAEQTAAFASVHEQFQLAPHGGVDMRPPEEAEEVSDNYLELLVRKAIGALVEDADPLPSHPHAAASEMEDEDQEEIILFQPARRSVAESLPSVSAQGPNLGMRGNGSAVNLDVVRPLDAQYPSFGTGFPSNLVPNFASSGVASFPSNAAAFPAASANHAGGNLGNGCSPTGGPPAQTMWGGFGYGAVGFAGAPLAESPSVRANGPFDWGGDDPLAAPREGGFPREPAFNPQDGYGDKRAQSRFVTRNPFAS